MPHEVPELPEPDYVRVFDEAPAPFLLLTPDLAIVRANRAFLAAGTLTLEKAVGRHLFDLVLTNPGDPTASGVVHLRAALERVLTGLFAILDEAGAREGPPVERLRHIVRGQVAVLLAELPYVTLLLRVRGNTDTERWALEQRRAFDGRVAALVREAVDRGDLRPGLDPALAARLLSGLVNSVAEWYRPGRPDAATLPDDVARAAFEGILPTVR